MSTKTFISPGHMKYREEYPKKNEWRIAVILKSFEIDTPLNQFCVETNCPFIPQSMHDADMRAQHAC